MGRPKKEIKEFTDEEIKKNILLKKLELNVIHQMIEARRIQHLSQREVGERSGIIRETIAKIENNLNSPQINTLIKILEPIGFTLSVVPLEVKEEEKEVVTE